MARQAAMTRLAAASVAMTAGMASGQAQMVTSGVQDLGYAGRVVQDFTIPDTPGAQVLLTVRGADGGAAVFGQKNTAGGEGATVTLLVTVGERENEIRPGGRLRFIVGEQGGLKRGNADGGGGGGGGGTGVLYEADGVGDDWIVLAVAGGGGGGFRGSGISRVGKNAPLGFNGDAGDNGGGKNGNGGQNGYGGEGGTNTQDTAISGGGGGILGDGVIRGSDVIGPNATFPGKKGLPSGGNGGQDQGAGAAGGWGCGGGGSGNDAGAFRSGGGGGGGYSGGGGGAQGRPGGGGGSYGEPMYGAVGASSGNIGNFGSAAYEFTRLPVPPADATFAGGVGLGGPVSINTFGSAIDTIIGLYDTRGELIAVNDNSPFAPGQTSLIETSLVPGEYWVVASHATNAPLDNFGVESDPSLGGQVSTSINGVAFDATVPSGGHVWYRFLVGTQPTGVTDLGVVGVSGDVHMDTIGSSFDTVIGLYSEAGALLAENDDGNGLRSVIDTTLDPGRYYLMVTGWPNDPEGFFTFDKGDSTGRSGSIQGVVNGTAFSGSVGPGAATFYSFEIAEPVPLDITDLGVTHEAGLTIVNTLGLSFNPALTLLGADGGVLATAGHGSGITQPQIVTTLSPGIYYAGLAVFPDRVGENFTLIPGDGSSGGGTLSTTISGPGGSVSVAGSLAAGQAKFYRFEISAPPQPCGSADLAQPFGVISQADVTAFVSAFFENDPRVASMAEPFDVISNADVSEFVRLFQAGCPN